MIKGHKTLFAFITLLWMSVTTASSQVSLSFSSAKRGPVIGDLQYGIFYEEINHGGDGGLYAELIRNRSFEDNAGNYDCWWGLGGMTAELVTTGLLNSAQGEALKLTVNEYNAGIRNEGFWGMNIVAGEEYTLTFWAKSDNTYNGKMWAELQDDVFNNLGRTEFDISLTKNWQKYTVKITATASQTKGWLALKGLEPMEIYLDVVSLMPPTYKNRANGCRRDLAKMLADLHPSFVRFPGGCYVEGTWQDGKSNRFEWKKTIGAIETRPGHMNVNWGYRVSDGLGFHELLQFTEDIGAEPLFVCNIGLGHGWQEDYNNIGAYIQEALDAIEYCNGDVSTTYGAMRAANGHPEPFNLRLLEIGNENYNFISGNNADMSDHYAERYAAFYNAIKAKYPDMVLIGNVESWATDNPSWRNGNPVEVVDEHYYRSTEWFRQQYNKYDTYSREGYKVYAGEYAVTSNYGSWGNLNAALAEAIYMAGMERNSDVCTMSSYAPIFCNEHHAWPWMPDMIRFNSTSAFGTPSYWVQQMMANNVGRQNITWEEKGNVINVRNSAVGLSSWGTNVSYDNFKISDLHGQTIYSTDFSDNDDYTVNWNATGGDWNISGGSLNQTSGTMYGNCNVCYNFTGENSVIEVDATKKSGPEGFLIAFSYNDPNNYVWWNLGGWNNTQHAIEQCVDGVKTTLLTAPGSLESNKQYHLKVIKAEGQVYCYVGDSLYHQISLGDARRLYTAAALNAKEDTLIVKLINPNSNASETSFQFKDFQYKGRVTLQVLKGTTGNEENTMQNQTNVKPTNTYFTPTSSNPNAFSYKIPAYSLCVMKIPVTNVSEESSEEDDNDGWTDISDQLKNRFFTEGQTGWTGSAFSATPGTVAEYFNTNFNVYQTLKNMPAGYYRFEIDGFYRNGSISNAYQSHINNREKLNAQMYIEVAGSTNASTLMSLYDRSAPFVYMPEYSYPDNTAGANIAFNIKKAYKENTVIATVENAGATLKVGLKKTVSVGNDWTCFDNARLYYKPFNDTPDAIEEETVEGMQHKQGVYDMTGRKVADNFDPDNLPKGMYIVNGKKVILN